MVILTLSNIIIAALRKIIPNNIRIACFIVVIAGFVTIVDLCLQAFIPALSKSLGLFIPLIVVNCIILGRAEAFAYKNGIGASALDGIFQGLGYTMAAGHHVCGSRVPWKWHHYGRPAGDRRRRTVGLRPGHCAYPHPARGHSRLWA